MKTHPSQSLFYDALNGSPPTGVKHANGAMPGIYENDGQAIRSLNPEYQTRSRRDQAVADKVRVSRCIDEMDDVGMNLAERNQWKGL
jgi:hypothetical protein